MSSYNKNFRRDLSVKWVKGSSGTTYLCPVDLLKNRGKLTEEELKQLCLDESANPHND